MNYEFVVLPMGAVDSPAQVRAYVRTQDGQPVNEQLHRFVVTGLHLWNSRVPAAYRHAELHIEAAGDSVRITAADRADRRRHRGSAVDSAADAVRRLLEGLIGDLEYQLYDAATDTLWRPR
ncbi:hypothetical protein DFR70_118109 [Nocardia tenerifensis]|uniref:Uncharacterized protein n=1 Tax=Nocardia tenerifensis TaxID=228006 RepID=A0A318JTV6_9NOCA|nr:hypothetical protein [Nocardia tenerifensis]PXX57454.1 hypothetical protein DFR70_118109 [Nocardia tenerifensis]